MTLRLILFPKSYNFDLLEMRGAAMSIRRKYGNGDDFYGTITLYKTYNDGKCFPFFQFL